jgi:hypothetical protein
LINETSDLISKGIMRGTSRGVQVLRLVDDFLQICDSIGIVINPPDPTEIRIREDVLHKCEAATNFLSIKVAALFNSKMISS